jgi:glycosyltransferase involved in cell wall biosynthesis
MAYPLKVSAAICSYNRARFVIKAVDSIFNQDFDKSQFEVIVVDNNSTDNVLELLAAYKEQHPSYNFRYFTETNQGKAFFASLDKLGAFIFKDFESGKRKTVY